MSAAIKATLAMAKEARHNCLRRPLAYFGMLLPRVSLFALFVFITAAPALAEKRVALVIGNDRYANLSAGQQLQKAVNDAQAMGDAFARLGFKVIRGSNLGRQAIIDKIAELTKNLDAGDTAAFFYAGHGVAISGVNYLVPADVPQMTPDGEVRVRGASIAEPDIVSELQAKRVRVALIVLDACRDNPFPRSGTRSLGNTRGLADAKPARGVFTIYSAGIGQTALDRLQDSESDRNSVFTRVFVEQLAKPGLDLAGLAIEVREKVAALAMTVNHEQTPAYYDQTIGGRIFLAGRLQANVSQMALSNSNRPTASLQSQAGQAWTIVQNTTSPAVLEDYIRQFASTPYGSMARARLQELRSKDEAGQLLQGRGSPSAPQVARLMPYHDELPLPRAVRQNCADRLTNSGVEHYCASSQLSAQFGNSYGIKNLFSGGSSVAWVEGKSDYGIGEWVTVAFDRPRLLKSIQIDNGYQKSSDIFYKNSRLKRIRLQFSSGENVAATVDDRFGTQTVSLAKPIKASWVQLIIEDVYRGKKYSDTAISKLMVDSERAE